MEKEREKVENGMGEVNGMSKAERERSDVTKSLGVVPVHYLSGGD